MIKLTLHSKLMASLALAIVVSAPVNAQDSDREQMIDMVLQIQQLQDEVRELRGLLEEQAHLINTLQRRQRDQYLDLDQRIGELANFRPAVPGQPTLAVGGGDVSPGVSSGTPATPQPLPVETAPPQDMPEVREDNFEPAAVAGLATPEAQGRTVTATPEEVQQAYDRAFQALKALNYADAAQEFQDFLQLYPDSELADNAQYWLGESYYVTRNFEIALEAFQNLLNNYPQSLKVPDSLLKVGYTHYELKQWEQARAALSQVQEQYPNTTVARLAENRLRSMRVEGRF